MFKKIILLSLAALLMLSLTGCSGQTAESFSNETELFAESGSDENSGNSNLNAANGQAAVPTELEVRFGDEGDPYAIHLYENDTAATIAGYVGTTDWRLPIYNYNDYDNWEVMQYYDIPDRYEIPSNPESIASAKAGEVFYSDPNRIVLFYRDAEIAGEYTKIGYIDYSEKFLQSVEDNPVLEGWENKIIHINGIN